MDSRIFRCLVLFTWLLLGFVVSGQPVFGMSADSADGVRISGLVPPDLAADVSVTSPLTIEFNGPGVSQSFYQTIQVGLFQGSRTIPGEMFYNPATRQVMFKPEAKLNNGQTYTAQLSFRDAQGNPVEKIWSFRTSGGEVAPMSQSFSQFTAPTSAPSVLPAAVSQERAPGGQLKIARASMSQGTVSSQHPLELTFSEPLDLSTLKDAPIKLYQGKQQQGVDYKLSKDLRTVSIIPRNALNGTEGYNIVIHQQLAGSSGARPAKSILIPFRVQNAAQQVEEQAVPDWVVDEAPPDENEPVDSFYSAPVSRAQPTRRALPTGNESAALNLPSTLPANPPLKVVGLTPRNGDIIQNNNQPIAVAFNTEVRPETLNEFTFRLEDDFGPVPGRIKYFPGKKQAILTPIGVLDSTKTYRVILTEGVSDPYGQRIQTPLNTTFSVATSQARRRDGFSSPAPKVASVRKPAPPRQREEVVDFSTMEQSPRQVAARDFLKDSQEIEGMNEDYGDEETAAAPTAVQLQRSSPVAHSGSTRTAAGKRTNIRADKLSAFRIQAITPTSNAKNVARDSHIIIRFSEPVDPGTINGINISVFGNQRRVEGHVTYNRQNRQATFTPKDKLNAETEYKVVINDKIRSIGGEALVGRYSWQFLTNSEIRNRYAPSQAAARSDSSFSIPLIDRKKTQNVPISRSGSDGSGQSPTFSYLASSHWVFKTIRHITGKGLLSTYPFNHNTKVSRYECAMSVKMALDNLKAMASAPGKPKLRLADLVHLENLVVEFRPELRSLRTDTGWFESFLQEQGVNISEIENKVQSMTRG
jgi:hypothetical protein